jgi:hypothetical protein
MILTRAQAPAAGMVTLKGSKLAEIEVPVKGKSVTGSKTVQVEVREP